MKVKMFSKREVVELEDEINIFIKDKEVVDIKFSISDMPRYAVIVIYK